MKTILEKPFITYGLIVIMVIIFGIMTISMPGGSTNPMTLISFGAKYNPLIISGEYYRLITPTFLHIGSTHLLMNMVTLYLIGNYVESLFGHYRYLIVFLIAGLMGNLASFAFNSYVSAGASTAIFGLFGAFLMLGESFQNNPVIVSMAKTFLLFIGINFVADIFLTEIDIYGHLGGLIGGFLIAYVVGTPVGKVPATKRIIAAITLILVGIVLFKLGINNG